MKKTLQDWLSWQETLHLSEIDLGLERIGRVAEQLGLLTPSFPIITVAGTNGKGSTVAFLNEMLQAEGYKTGAYTSPHLINYNERITINSNEASDALIIEAFDAIDQARFITNKNNEIEEVSLTYFEFSTLAAMWCFQQQDIDVAVLEVGLGGRLDAANLWDTNLAIITSIDVDHIDWLGDDRELIAKEKAGIMRSTAPAICGDPTPPEMIKTEAERLGIKLIQLNEDFSFSIDKNDPEHWIWRDEKIELSLPKPRLQGDFQINNASTAIAGLMAIQDRLPTSPESISAGLQKASITGRLQIINESPEWLLDVAHNPHSAKELSKYIDTHKVSGKTFALFSMLKDKDIDEVLKLMDPVIDEWHIVPLEGSRGTSLTDLKQQFTDSFIDSNLVTHERFSDACQLLKNITKDEDRVVAFGSFLVVSEVLDNSNFRRFFNHG
ncbi:bifunctional tetrahydrofolate synthase/dihydrofolate synthase [Cocleimonas sp. KMM 6892]|uniref:bifunctional tetrahydrofolate synthase/dihydrofolate synthase n=1 Tax=unclassified Cocleimonas TaxID=2639732 RepID=UPI002DBD83D2|nr:MULTISPECIES: bifunctional tetrahydrofolate synthase/dihydrofolate synthase [unclassified Cocleimonas]MEB8433467.1 bifunctional tetrahydrofolate synthase/dihydrofolate synthase [Cocleimonas sp. KMM 6892]MEC4716278.1 bifunctional tetrahydrofolate synthase/dihydrofolate synthase [Cocleimonas sp. KMM 6895]MEC4745829.1 bifunctional tetrahydrofolate synthase/dihydrofolate synthase [Cocleimonas sp. KMM 6896]